MKKIFYVFGIFFLVFLFSFLLYFNKITVFEAVSDGGTYKIKIIGKGSFLFSSEEVEIFAYRNNVLGFFDFFKYNTSIANDGKHLNGDNFFVKWKDDIAILTLFGEEQEDEVFNIDYSNKTIKHRIEYYKIVPNVNEMVECEHKGFEYLGSYSQYLSCGVKAIDEHGDDMVWNRHKEFIRTLKYQVEEGIISVDWYSKGNAYVYTGLDFVFIDCSYDRYNKDYAFLRNVSYKRYIISSPDTKYSYDLCKPNKQ